MRLRHLGQHLGRHLAPGLGRAARPALVPVVALALATPAALAQPSVPADPSGVLNLQASATQEVDHDLMSLVFGTSREGSDAQAVQSALRQALDAALAEARKVARAPQLEVETGNFSLYPRPATKAQPAGWTGQAELRVHGRDFTAISQLAGRIQTMSIARVGYGLSRERREEVEAGLTKDAVERFRARATDYARLFGYAGFTVRDVTVSGSEAPGAVPMFRARAMAAADESLPVEAGKGSVSVQVSGSVQMTR